MKAVTKTGSSPAREAPDLRDAQNLRDAHKDLTRGRILDAALALIGEGVEITIAAVAARAGMTDRTIYRHFSTRDDLMTAVWEKVNSGLKYHMPATTEELVEQPRHMFPDFDKQAAVIRAIVFSQQGHEMRMRVNDARQAAMRKAVRTARPDLKEPEFTRLCATVQLLDSAFTWSAMKDYWGLDGEEAGRAASEAIATLLARAYTDKASSKQGRHS
ncbi:MAG: TetR/AcrR family transcriptional regulator [Hyphomonadaceae bacterium]|nr:TetR/AcrR family transcriptional regulator [Hyphomonadaceae bacterium]